MNIQEQKRKDFILNKGFTLIELLVVISIIGVLSTVVLGSLSDARSRAKDAKILAETRTLQNALELYIIDNGSIPDLPSGFPAVTNCQDQNNSFAQFSSVGISDWEDFINDLGDYLPQSSFPESPSGSPCLLIVDGGACAGGELNRDYLIYTYTINEREGASEDSTIGLYSSCIGSI